MYDGVPAACPEQAGDVLSVYDTELNLDMTLSIRCGHTADEPLHIYLCLTLQSGQQLST